LDLPVGWAKLNIPAAAAVLLRAARQRMTGNGGKAG
jgi:hypothetical protein